MGLFILPDKVSDLLEKTIAGVGDEIQLTDALVDLLKLDSLNAFETDASMFECGDEKVFLSANLAVRMRGPGFKAIIEKSSW